MTLFASPASSEYYMGRPTGVDTRTVMGRIPTVGRITAAVASEFQSAPLYDPWLRCPVDLVTGSQPGYRLLVLHHLQGQGGLPGAIGPGFPDEVVVVDMDNVG